MDNLFINLVSSLTLNPEFSYRINMKDGKIKKHFSIGIDTAFNKSFSYIAFGPSGQINRIKDAISHICLRNGIKKMHFSEIRDDKRKLIYNEVIKTCLDIDQVNYYILKHVKPSGHENKDFYLRFLPEEYTNLFDFLKKDDCIIEVDVHDDFGVAGITNSTYHLLESLAKYFTRKFTDVPGIFRNNDKDTVLATVKCKETGKTLKFNFNRSNSQVSNAIIVADVILGFYYLKSVTKNTFFSETKLDERFLSKVKYRNINPLSP
jgi:hypothetical protein